jgi:hypothetical protein
MIHRLTPGGEVGLRGPIPTLSLRPEDYDKIVMARPYIQVEADIRSRLEPV